MILKGSQRAFGQNLAAHLMKLDDNEHVALHQLRGFAADDLKGAFKEAEAISRGTKCSQYLFSLSLSPPEQERVPPAIFERAIDTIEQRLGLEGQPRAIVFHEKEGRRHAHCVWSRIDAETMTARPMSFFKNRLTELSRGLYLEHGWKMPDGIRDSAKRDPKNFTLAEWQQAKRQGGDPRWLKQSMQECWAMSDDRKALGRALEERGFFLAKGDKRGFVVLDHQGEVYSLPKMLGLKTKEVRERLGDGDLPTVEATQKTIGARMTPAIRRHVEESRTRFLKRSATLGHAKMEMTHHHRDERAKFDERQRRDWDEQNRARAARLPKGLKGLWHRLTGDYQKARALNEAEAERTRQKQAQERQALIDRQRDQRAALQAQFKELRHGQAQQLRELRREIGRFLILSRGHSQTPERSQRAGLGLRLER
ncbi:relaxase/mobilization nuclease domain-containing protein [Bosea sp. (in: a-proteobacteria)]|uniref:relaxase/mobilization nuclease domain-containing protein n=1 Tax=Bosea sp. (in: a-proteobacteria) TaxID=1871050 RepID=UPI00273601E9|nr:relaxase/mobilization nuclease domain-containing protein [Bosea sp. (in: a-proteobacteria)]MDP3408562.1 relaxase/mobilization nuclease domain-containing protein [Bosea sp. (in: a-proteobacteria)]